MKKKTRWGLCLALGAAYAVPVVLCIQQVIEHGWAFVGGTLVALGILMSLGSCAPVGGCGCR